MLNVPARQRLLAPRQAVRLLALLAVAIVGLMALPRSVQAVTFSNLAPITIADEAPAVPYPSTITVAGVPGFITKVTVTFTGLNHTTPFDLDVLLVSPSGTKFILLSSVCDFDDWVNATVTLDDAAASIIPKGAENPGPTCPSGTFRPTSYSSNSLLSFYPQAPAGPYLVPAPGGSGSLAVFNGENPNGVWSLYVQDVLETESGSITGGWSLDITTAPDTTAPELSISVDPTTKDVRVEGVPAAGEVNPSDPATTNPIAPAVCTSQRPGQQQCIYRATDLAGNSVTATLLITKTSGQTQVVVQRLQYSGKPATTPLTNSLAATYAPASGTPSVFNQTAQATDPGPPSGSRKVTASWTSASASTTITYLTSPFGTTICPGATPAPLALVTRAGALTISAGCPVPPAPVVSLAQPSGNVRSGEKTR